MEFEKLNEAETTESDNSIPLSGECSSREGQETSELPMDEEIRIWETCMRNTSCSCSSCLKPKKTCCLCGNKTECPYGNNPAPIAELERGVCCNKCNQVVILVRLGIIPLELAQQNENNLKMLFDLVAKTETDEN